MLLNSMHNDLLPDLTLVFVGRSSGTS